MTDRLQNDSLIPLRLEARQLLKQLRSSNPEEAECAADRFRTLRSFSSATVNDLSFLSKRVQLKHALALVAQEKGYESWTELKTASEHSAYSAVLSKPSTASTPSQKTEAEGDDIDFAGPVELVALSIKDRAARCRLLKSGKSITLRARRIWDIVPGEIVLVRPRKRWRYSGHFYLSGEIEATRLDVSSLGLVPLELAEMGTWEPDEHYWGEEDEPIEEWAKPIIAKGPRPEFRMQMVTPGEDPEDEFWDPITEAADLKDAGDYREARRILMNMCDADLRCLDAHAHLGNLVFDYSPKEAIRHYAAGLRIGELSLGNGFDGVLRWGYVNNRPFLRCMHAYGLCLWRLGRLDEAKRVFMRMLWLNPSDNQGARFLLGDVSAGMEWAGLYAKKSH